MSRGSKEGRNLWYVGRRVHLWVVIHTRDDGSHYVYTTHTSRERAQEDVEFLEGIGQKAVIHTSFLMTPVQRPRAWARDTIARLTAKKWVRWIGGHRVRVAPPEQQHMRFGLGGSAGTRYWYNAFLCRILGHSIDGTEWGTRGGGYYDSWCSRCFFYHRELRWDEVPWVAARHHHLTMKGEMPPVGGGPAEA